LHSDARMSRSFPSAACHSKRCCLCRRSASFRPRRWVRGRQGAFRCSPAATQRRRGPAALKHPRNLFSSDISFRRHPRDEPIRFVATKDLRRRNLTPRFTPRIFLSRSSNSPIAPLPFSIDVASLNIFAACNK